jgi:hypothetical protein
MIYDVEIDILMHKQRPRSHTSDLYNHVVIQKDGNIKHIAQKTLLGLNLMLTRS